MDTASRESLTNPPEEQIMGQTFTSLTSAYIQGKVHDFAAIRMLGELGYFHSMQSVTDPELQVLYDYAAFGNGQARADACKREANLLSNMPAKVAERNLWIQLATFYEQASLYDPTLSTEDRSKQVFDREKRGATTTQTPYREFRKKLETLPLHTYPAKHIFLFYLRSEYEFYAAIADRDSTIGNALKPQEFNRAISLFIHDIAIPKPPATLNPYFMADRAYYTFTGNHVLWERYAKEQQIIYNTSLANMTQTAKPTPAARELQDLINQWQKIQDWIQNGCIIAKQEKFDDRIILPPEQT